MKFISLINVLVAVLVIAQAEAQNFPPLFPFRLPPTGLTSVLNVSGVVTCSVNASVNGTTPANPFPNALVQLVCGQTVVGSTVTNQTGAFSIIANSLLSIITNLFSNCRVVVATPLANCNATLPINGTLQAPILIVGNTIRGSLNITNAVAEAFLPTLGA